MFNFSNRDIPEKQNMIKIIIEKISISISDPMNDIRRKMRLELLTKLYERYGNVSIIEDGELFACAEYFHEDEMYCVGSSMNIWGLQDKEITYFFSGSRLDMPTFEANMRESATRSDGMIMPDRKLRCATLTTIMIYDTIDNDVQALIEKHDDKVYHRMSLNGWSINRVAAVLTDSHQVITDKRSRKLARRLGRIAEI